MLEKIKDFFDKRAGVYDKHQLNEIEGAKDFYIFGANQLPLRPNAHVLDIGCGTGIELEYYFKRNNTAHVDGIDISKKMLQKAKNKIKSDRYNFIEADMFTYEYNIHKYEAAISVEVMHHFLPEKKMELYKKIYKAIKGEGYFILIDYFATNDDQEKQFKNQLEKMIKDEKLNPNETYHFDIPLTLNHEIDCLHRCGFRVLELGSWGQTTCLKCTKR